MELGAEHLGRLSAVTLSLLPRLCCTALLSGSVMASAWGQASAPISVEQGLRIMVNREQGNCITCHRISTLPESLGQQGNFGPALDGVGARYSPAQLRQWVLDARRIKPDTLMPPFGTLDGLQRPNVPRPLLTPEQIEQVVAALAALR